MTREAKRRVLVIGATGNFGRRICKRLVTDPGIHLLASSRSLASAERLVEELSLDAPAARVSAVALDQAATSLRDDLRAIDPFVAVHTAGPYQGQDYRVAEACVHHACHYVDLADGRDFVMNFAALNEAAFVKDILLVSGASTLPALSGAVIEKLRTDFASLESVGISIAPGHRTPRGSGTVAAVLSYCGQEFAQLRDGEWRKTYGWQDWRVFRYPRMRRRVGGACDVPDLVLLPARFPELRSVSFHAALEAPWEQFALWLMAGLTRLRIVNDWSRLAKAFRRLSDALDGLGSDTGAMHVRLRGTDLQGQPLDRCWFLTARHNNGPEIPAVPAVIVVRKLLAGTLLERGATSCYGLISLDEFEREVAALDFEYDVVDRGDKR